MQKYRKIKKIKPVEIRRLTGVRLDTFQEMISILQKAEKKGKDKGAKPQYLKLKDKLLVALEYLREYRAYFHLGQIFK